MLRCAYCIQVLTPMKLTLFSCSGQTKGPFRSSLNRPIKGLEFEFDNETSPSFSGEKKKEKEKKEKMNCYILSMVSPAEQWAVRKRQQ